MQASCQVTLNDLEFLAEESEVWVIPKLSMPKLPLPSRDAVGPFKDGLPVPVPLWVALALKKQRKCSIITPDWMKAEALTEQLTQERASEGLCPVEYHFIQISSLLLTYAADDIPNVDRVRSLIADLDNLRHQKIEKSFLKLLEARGRVMNNNVVPIVNMSCLEADRMRPQMLRAMDKLAELHRIALTAGVAEDISKRAISAEEAVTPRALRRNLRG